MEPLPRRRRRSRPLVAAFLRDPGSGRVYRRGKLIGKVGTPRPESARGQGRARLGSPAAQAVRRGLRGASLRARGLARARVRSRGASSAGFLVAGTVLGALRGVSVGCVSGVWACGSASGCDAVLPLGVCASLARVRMCHVCAHCFQVPGCCAVFVCVSGRCVACSPVVCASCLCVSSHCVVCLGVVCS